VKQSKSGWEVEENDRADASGSVVRSEWGKVAIPSGRRLLGSQCLVVDCRRGVGAFCSRTKAVRGQRRG
jgi:hypothetical protein